MLFDLPGGPSGQRTTGAQADTYRSALELVTGKVFTYPSRAGSSFGWIDTENLLSQWEVKIQAIAQQCIESYLAIGAPEQAIEVANHVLQALPLNTPLTEALMRAHAATGDLTTVDTVYRAYTDGLFESSTPTTTRPLRPAPPAPSPRRDLTDTDRAGCSAGEWSLPPSTHPDRTRQRPQVGGARWSGPEAK